MTRDRHYDVPKVFYDEDDTAPSNKQPSVTFAEVLRSRLSRRQAIAGMLATTALSPLLGVKPSHAAAESPLGFTEIPHGYDDKLHVPEGYKAQILIRWGDKVAADAPDFDPMKQTGDAQAKQFGYNCDFIKFLPLPEGSDTSDHGLLWVNHEYTNTHLMMTGFADSDAVLAGATAEICAVEQQGHGGSIIEIKRDGSNWSVVPDSSYNRRITPMTPMELRGPAAGHERLKTSTDASGTKVLGMLNNCAGGWTPWGTILSGEENFHGYFGGDPAGTAEETNHKRYGMKGEPWYAWGKFEQRFDVTKEMNEPNRFGWIVEVDPYDPASTPIKHTALGRMKHEGATVVINPDGRLVAYTGDDERFEYVYKYVSNGTYDAAKGKENSALLDDGTLYVAKFADDGSVDWLPLNFGTGPLNEANGFKSQADVMIEARRAADLLGATAMDRPEDIETHPDTGKAYIMLTKNDKRKADKVDGPNARAENLWGQIVELIPPEKDGKRDHSANKFNWEVFIQAGNPADAAHGAKYGVDVGANGWFANPDNLAFDPEGRMWIATDGFPDAGVHDGLWATETEGAGRAVTKHFLGCPSGAELCGPEFTPDGTTLFVSVQHPGDDKGSNFDKPSTRWPDFADNMPPRPSVVAITKEDGGTIGS